VVDGLLASDSGRSSLAPERVIGLLDCENVDKSVVVRAAERFLLEADTLLEPIAPLSLRLRFHSRLKQKIERMALQAPDDKGVQIDLSISWSKIGDVLVAQGHCTEALSAFHESRLIFEG